MQPVLRIMDLSDISVSCFFRSFGREQGASRKHFLRTCPCFRRNHSLRGEFSAEVEGELGGHFNCHQMVLAGKAPSGFFLFASLRENRLHGYGFCMSPTASSALFLCPMCFFVAPRPVFYARMRIKSNVKQII